MFFHLLNEFLQKLLHSLSDHSEFSDLLFGCFHFEVDESALNKEVRFDYRDVPNWLLLVRCHHHSQSLLYIRIVLHEHLKLISLDEVGTQRHLLHELGEDERA
jgi:hypothetical protein